MLLGSRKAKVQQRRRASRCLRSGLCAAAGLLLLLGAGQAVSERRYVGGPAEPPDADAAQSTSHSKAAGVIGGVVLGPNGALVHGASVSLVCSDPAVKHVSSDSDGRFQFTEVPAGQFTLTVSLEGFDPVSVTGNLHPGRSYAFEPVSLHLSTVSFVVDAVASPEELGLEQVHAEEQQRLLGVLPNFFVSYNWDAPPLTTHEKFALATKNATDPGNLLLVGTVAGVQQAENAFPGYRQGAAGYGKRYGASLANLVAGTYMGGAVLPSLLRQDPRYFYKGTGSAKSRFWYAVSRAIICRGDNGRWQPNFSGVLGDLSAGAISNIYYPASDRQGAVLTLENGLLGVAGDAMNNVFQEFFLKKLTPKLQKTTSTSEP